MQLSAGQAVAATVWLRVWTDDVGRDGLLLLEQHPCVCLSCSGSQVLPKHCHHAYLVSLAA
jgi:hypothetical protein